MNGVYYVVLIISFLDGRNTKTAMDLLSKEKKDGFDYTDHPLLQ